VVKVNAHYSDGTSEPKLLHKYGFKRPYYITKPKYRNHREKKTYEHIEKLDRFECTQSELIHHVGRRLQRQGKLSLRQLGDSPYLYGTDILSTAVLVHQLRRKYKAANETPSRRSLAVLDIDLRLGVSFAALYFLRNWCTSTAVLRISVPYRYGESPNCRRLNLPCRCRRLPT
jgi:hypothetical protein